MTFPSETGSRKESLGETWGRVRSLAARVKSRAQQLKDISLAGTCDGWHIIDFSSFLASSKAKFTAAASFAGLVAFAREQMNDATLDAVAEINALVAQIDATTGWIAANVPVSAQGYAQLVTLNAGGTYTWRPFNAAQTASLRTQLDALIAAID